MLGEVGYCIYMDVRNICEILLLRLQGGEVDLFI